MRSKLSEGSIICKRTSFPFAVDELGYEDGCSVLQVHPGRMLFVEDAPLAEVFGWLVLILSIILESWQYRRCTLVLAAEEIT